MDFGRLEVRHRKLEISGNQIFYREAGNPESPSILLLHGFPCSSHQYRHLLVALADRYHLIAPDFPGFGFSDHPSRSQYAYTFDHYADTIQALTEALGLVRYALYAHDYGAQVGFRLAMRFPERLTALIVQNSEAYYREGRSPIWSAAEAYWRDSSFVKREELRRKLFTREGIRQEFIEQLPSEIVELLDPGTIELAWMQICRPGVIEALLDLHHDYRRNVELYPSFQEFFRKHRPPTLILWGRHDQYYSAEAALAYKRDLPDAEVHILDGGHWLLETHGLRVAHLMRQFLARQNQSQLAA